MNVIQDHNMNFVEWLIRTLKNVDGNIMKLNVVVD